MSARRFLPFALLLFALPAFPQCVSLTTPGTAYTQNFDTLANSGTSSTLPAGWLMLESNTNSNTLYTAGTGSGTAGDTYSFGAAASTERAFGMLFSNALTPLIGACFTNNTGSAITSLEVAYRGELWRAGAASRTDRIDFQYSVNASSLGTGTWTDVDALDYTTPVQASAGAINGNAINSNIASTISSLSISNGATFYIRWQDLNVSGSDDGVGVDDFSITPAAAGGGGLPTLSINDVSQVEGDSGTTAFTFTVSLSAPAGGGGVTFDIATADSTALAGTDYVSKSLTGQSIASGNSTYSFSVTVNGDSSIEPNETFFVNVTNAGGATISDGQGAGTILNDDIAPISQIQGSGTASPLVGTQVTSGGIVTAVTTNGFFLQTASGQDDGNPATSEGIFVFTSSAPPAAASVGNRVTVTGTVSEFGTAPKTLTELTTPTVTQISTGNALPSPVAITSANLTPGGGLSQLERYEAMRVAVASLTVTQPTDGSVNANSATATSDGAFYGVVTGTALPFREAGIETPLAVPACGGCVPPTWDANPEVLRVKSNGLPGQPKIDVTAYAVVTNLTGILDSFQGKYSIVPDGTTTPGVSGDISPTAVPVPGANEVTVGAYNMERFFDDINDPALSGEPVLSSAAFTGRLQKASLGIRNFLRSPDVLAVEEFENLITLQALATRINSDAVADSQPNPGYVAYLTEGADIGGIDVGFLVKSTVTVTTVTQGAVGTFINPSTGDPEQLNDRPPLILEGSVSRNGKTLSLTVIVNHLRSLIDIEDGGATGDRVRTKRRAQAEFLANLIQARQAANPNAHIVALGDFNAFDVNDGYVDSVGTILGTPTPASQVVKASPDLVNPNLNLLSTLFPAAQRYSYRFEGNAQTIDHMMLTQGLFDRATTVAYGRINADFPESLRGTFSTPERISDHDPVVVYLNAAITPVTSQVSVFRSGFTYSAATQTSTGTVRLTNTSGSAIAGPIHFVVNNPVSTITLKNPSGENAQGRYITVPGPLAPGASVTIPVQFLNPTRGFVTYTPKVISGAF